MRWTGRQHCECETGPISVWTWLGVAFVVAAALFAEPIIESLPW